MKTMKCDQCEAAMINGVFCHEMGCPNSKKQWHDGEWVKVYECHECGTDYFEAIEAAECCAPTEPKFREAKMILFCSDASGQYIPQSFATEIVRERLSGVDMADLDYLARGPKDLAATDDEPAHNAEAYWDVWADVLDSAVITDIDGMVYLPYQDGDLWLVEQGAELNDKFSGENGGPDETGCDTLFVVRL